MPHKKTIITESSQEVYDYLYPYLAYPDQTYLSASNSYVDMENIEAGHYKTIINLKRINDFNKINRYFRTINHKLPDDGIFIISVETYAVRKHRILKKYWFPFNWVYYAADVILTRVSPKIPLTKRLYFYLSGGKGRVLSKTEILGRLSYNGFDIIDEKEINNKLWITAQKKSKPIQSDYQPSYGIFVKLPRVGKDGKLIKVYKFRTMHPYAEYIQHYVYQKNNLKKGGKLNNDFRISTLGKFFRKYWIDELPMIINLLKGDMKLVGVRPLSRHYLSLYNDEIKQLRLKTKPGLLPPFYADMPETLQEIQESERAYLQQYLKNPLKTDCLYLYKILKNIVLHQKRSS